MKIISSQEISKHQGTEELPAAQPSEICLEAASNFWLRNYNNLTEMDREEMRVDEVLALYLYRLSGKVNAGYWKRTLLPFVILYRECLNEYGWSKKLGDDTDTPVTQQFCLTNNADSAPDISNEFITAFMEQK